MATETLAAISRQFRLLAELDTYADPIPLPGPSGEKPDDTWLKSDIHDWLVGGGVDVPAGATKAELLGLIDDADD